MKLILNFINCDIAAPSIKNILLDTVRNDLFETVLLFVVLLLIACTITIIVVIKKKKRNSVISNYNDLIDETEDNS